MKESKSRAGGKREGAGKKPREIPGVKRQFVIDADLSEQLDTYKSYSAIVNLALREYFAKTKKVS